MTEKLKKLLQKLKYPKGWLLALIYVFTVVFCSASITLAAINSEKVWVSVLAYVCYAGAALFLTCAVYSIVIYAHTIKERLTLFIKKFKFGKRMLEEYSFRTIIFAALSVLINIAYVAFHVVLAAITDSFFWYGSLAVYYGLLVFLRGGIVLYHKNRNNTENSPLERERVELKKYRTCGFVLALIPLCLLVPILQIIFLDKAFIHEGLSIFAFAAYAFYKIIMAIVNILRSGKETAAYTVQAVRSVGLADALVSIFSLQTALLYSFSEGANYSVFNLITGFAVFALTVALGIFMIIRANKKLRNKL